MHVLPCRRPSRFAQAFASALTLEAAIVAVAFAWMATHTSRLMKPAVPITVEREIVPVPETPAPEIKLPVPARKPELPTRKLLPEPVSAPTPAMAPTPQSAPLQPAALKEIPAPLGATAQPAQPIQPTLPPIAAAPAPPPVPVVDPSPAYNAQLTAAAQAAFVLPSVALDLGFKGRARIGFNLRDGVVSGVRVVQGSGLGAVDRAAVAAVQSARYPAPPAALAGKEMSYQIWVSCY